MATPATTQKKTGSETETSTSAAEKNTSSYKEDGKEGKDGMENSTSSSSFSSSTQGSKEKSKSGSADEPTLELLFENCLKDIYSAEQQLLKALPEMAKAAYDDKLEDAFTEHLHQTKKHAERLEKIFTRLKITPGGETCKAMEGLIEEGNKIIKDYKESPVRDSALIIGAQKIEHYEIASYGSLCELADVLGYHKIMDVLDRTLAEEEKTDQLLTQIAEGVNDEAAEMAETGESAK